MPAPARLPKSESRRTARLLRVSTTLVFLLLGVSAYLLAEVVGSGTPRIILQSVGGFLIGTVVVSYAYEFFLGEESENRTVSKLDEVLERRINDIFPAAAKHGFNGFSIGAPKAQFDDLAAGDELLWLDTYSPDFLVFAEAVRASIARGARVRMLAVAPDSEAAAHRASEIKRSGFGTSEFKAGAQAFLECFSEIERQSSGQLGELEVRTYTKLPSIPMYLKARGAETVAGVTGYFLGEPSFDSVHIRWQPAPHGMLSDFRSYFEAKWEASDPVGDV